MDEYDIALPAPAGTGAVPPTTRPWTVKVLERVQASLQADKARFSIVKTMIDGNWHDLTSLWRVAKKQRPIGLVGVGMALNAVQESTGLAMFDVCGAEESAIDGVSGETDPVDSSWKIKDDYMGIIRAVVSTLDGAGMAGNAGGLGSALERNQLQRLARAGSLEP